MMAARWSDLTALGVVPAAHEPLALDGRERPDADNLRAAVALSKEMPLDLAEAVDGLARLWNLVLHGLPGRQAQALLLVCTRRGLSSQQLADLAGISLSNASGVFKALVARGLVKPVKDGVRVRYELAIVWPMGTTAKAAQLAMRRLDEALRRVAAASLHVGSRA
jgi:DNA-binding MarR family transcriptional regulator